MSYTLPEFLAHAIALEDEAAERYLELAEMMEVRRNDEVASLFRDMARFSQMHRDEIRARVGMIQLPKLMSWEYRWRISPEMGGEEAYDYMLEPHNVLRYARGNEVRAMEYYRSVSEDAVDMEVRRLASNFAEEEAEHAAVLEKWLAKTPRPASSWEPDPSYGSGR